MLTKEDINHLAHLARIAVSEEEKAELVPQMESVLAYVSEISKVVTKEEAMPQAGELRNVMREDGAPRVSGEFTEAILANAPKVEDGYVKVAQIQA